MSRRPSAVTLAAVLCLLATALAGPLLAPPAAAFGERVFAANPIAGSGNPAYPVYAADTVAQSFQSATTFLLQSVTLLVQNDGSNVNPLRVTLRPDDPVHHWPLMSVVLSSSSQVAPNNAGGPSNVTFPFNPWLRLDAATPYWIVAENSAPQGPPSNGYAWVNSNGNTYPNGSAFILDTSSGVWTGLPYDLYFSTYGRELASNVTLAVVANRTQAQPGDPVTFTVRFNNTGNQSAPNVWINETLSAGFSNPTPSFPEFAPVSPAAFPSLTFRNVPNGAHYFTVHAQVAYGTPPGSTLADSVTLAFENATGAVVRNRATNASIVVGLEVKQLYLGGASTPTKLLTTTPPSLSARTTSNLNVGAAQPLDFILGPALARPFVALNVTARLWISIVKVPPQNLKLNVSLLDNSSVVASVYPFLVVTTSGYQLVNLSFPALNYTFAAGHKIRLQIWSIGGGGGSTDTLVLAYNCTGNPSRLDLRTTTYVSVDQLLLGNGAGPVTIWSPEDPITVRANVSDPFGAGRIDGVWINITSPGNQLVSAGAMGLVSSDSSALPAWNVYGYTLNPPLSTGLYRVDVTAMEDNGVTSRGERFATVAVPDIQPLNLANVTRARAGMAFSYFVYYNDTGTGPAGALWINDSLPAEVTYVSSEPAYTSVAGSTYSWSFSNVGVGNHSLEIDMVVAAGSTSPAVIVSRATLVFTDSSGHPMPEAYANASLILNGPQIAVNVTTVPAAFVHANESVVYTIGLRNRGDAAADLWVNDTLPSGLVYGSDTARTLNGSRSVVGSVIHFHFANMPAATAWSFQLQATAATVLTRNASYDNGVALEYTALTGLLMPPSTAGSHLVAAAPWIPKGAITFNTVWTSPGATVEAAVRFANRGNELAPAAWVNLTLDVRLSLVNASSTFSGGGSFLEFPLTAVPVGATAIYLNLTVNGNTPDQTILDVLGTVDYFDGIGNPLPTVFLVPGSLPVDVAELTLNVTPAAPSIEAGTVFPLVVSIYNWGNGTTRDVWLNVTLPSSLMYTTDTSGTTLAVLGSAYSWHWTNQVPGPFQFDLYVEPREATPNGTAADLDFHAVYWDSQSRPRPALDSLVHAVVVAPSIVLSIFPSESTVQSGEFLTYALRVENRGLALAQQVQVIDDVDPSLQIISYAAPVAATGTQNLTWTFSDLAPGSSEWINLTVRVDDGLRAGTLISMALEANYTNSLGTPLDRIRSVPTVVTVEIDFTPYLAIVMGSVLAGILGYAYLTRRKKVEIEEVFLVYRDGVLISHLSRSLMREKDEDVLSGMLTAVQEFVREAFQYGEHRELHKLDFGEYRILIERGKYVYLAVVYSGEESPAIRKKVRTVIDRIEDQFGPALEKWDGDMEEVMGARDLIRDTLLGSANHGHNHNHAAKPPTQDE